MTDCGCCLPAAAVTPVAIDNRPGLSMVVYRIGTYSSFREAMLEAIARAPELTGLTTRADDDYSITLLDLWAAVCDVLTFYQERYANENYLRTATQPENVQRIVRLIGHVPRPGVAAETLIAFTLDKGKAFQIATGLRVQSLPAQGQPPQTFETVETITADARLNSLRAFPSPGSSGGIVAGATESVLDRLLGPAIASSLAPGDTIVLFQSGSTIPVEENKISALRVEDDRNIIAWSKPIANSLPAGSAFKFRRNYRIFGYNAPGQFMTASAANVPGGIKWTLNTLTAADFALGSNTSIALDGRYEDLAAGQKLLVSNTAAGGVATLVTVQSVRQAQGQSLDSTKAAQASPPDPVTILTIDTPLAFADRRQVLLYGLDGGSIQFWPQSYAPVLSGNAVFLPGVLRVDDQGRRGVEVSRSATQNSFKTGVVIRPDELPEKQRLIAVDENGVPVETAIQGAVTILPANPAPGDFCHLTIPLDKAVTGLLTRSAVLLGNVAAATHGETTRQEILGSGDASKAFQQFSLRKQPLTYVPTGKAGGVADALRVFVNNVLWSEVPSLFAQKPDAQVYTARTQQDGAVGLQFGDAKTGARLPTGASNVVATYRTGSGLAGRVAANALTTLLDRPTGLLSATNPGAAVGGADPESPQVIRETAPRTVRTFGRAVSLPDFEDIVTESGEVAKARATFLWDGTARAIHITVAGQEGGVFDAAALKRIGDALDAERDPNHRLILANFSSVAILLDATVQVDPAFVHDDVNAALRAAIISALSFDSRSLGASVHLSSMYAVLQAVPGVVFVDITRFLFKQRVNLTTSAFIAFLQERGVEFLAPTTPAPVQGHLRIFDARPDPAAPGTILPAELAVLETPAQDLRITAVGGV